MEINLGEVINDIQHNGLGRDRLLEYLKIPQYYIQSNVIMQLVKANICDDVIVDQIFMLKDLNSKRDRMSGIYTLGHLSVAALSKFNHTYAITRYQEAMQSLDSVNKSLVEDLLNTDVFDK